VPYIQVRHLFKVFGPHAATRAMPLLEAGASKDEILAKTGCTVGARDVSFNVERRETFVIMGLSGSGKSTVLRCLNRLTEPNAGQVCVGGENVLDLDAERLRELRRRRVSMVFQQFGLLPHRSVIDNVAFGLEVQGVDRHARYEQAEQAIRRVGLEAYEQARVQALSGGMRQRVGLARALAGGADILLMDEAFSALDPLIRTQMQDELLGLQAQLKKTIVFITHDLDEALRLGDRIAIIRDGAVVQIDTPAGILTRPADDYVRAFVQNVDRARVLTAEAIMRRDIGVLGERHSAAEALRRMQEQALEAVLVVDDDERLRGVLSANAARGAADAGRRGLDALVSTAERPIIHPSTPLRELLAPAARSVAPLPVVDEQGRLRGAVTRAALLAAVAGEAPQAPRPPQNERAETESALPTGA
jgi:glycine betaine/proline transport system ATP-binding protein